MEKNILIKEKVFTFNFREGNNFWYLGNNEFDFFDLGYNTDITINLIEPDWKEIKEFLYNILIDRNEMLRKLKKSNDILKKVFKEIYYNLMPEFNYNDLIFTLCNIEYVGKSEIKNQFKYVLNFNAESKSDTNFFTYDSWNVTFDNDILINATKVTK